jgi:phenylpyruvate tautomerase PptA (4-oxalocrotonate tautomerase family)
MPFYRCTVAQGSLSREQKVQLAGEFADIHCALTNGTPRRFVHVLFEEIPEGNAFCGGEPSIVAKTIGFIRSGRTQETRSALVAELTEMWRRVTGLGYADIVVAVHEVRPRDSMEWGVFLPEDGEEAQWVAEHDLARQGVVAT